MTTTMKIHYLQHVPFEGLGSIEVWAKRARHRISVTRFYAGDQLPALKDIDWLIVMGGPMNIYEDDRCPWLKQEKAFINSSIEKGKVILGICLGAQLIADAMGAKVYPNTHKEIGWFPVEPAKDLHKAPIGAFLSKPLNVFHWHGDTFDLPRGTELLASSQACRNQGFLMDNRIIGLQFHMEVTPDSAQNLIYNCRDELRQETFIQTADEMLANRRPFDIANQAMHRLLDDIEKHN
jgi:GMP synthase (glutamine-hydrolysing)